MMHIRFTSLILALLLFSAVACAQDGVGVGSLSLFRNLVPAQQLEQQASVQYEDMMHKASAQHALATDKNAQLKRLCVFQTNLDTDSMPNWTVIPAQTGH